MKAFHFRLGAVLQLRERAEEAAREACAKAYAAVEQATARLRSVQAALAASDELRRRELETGAPAGQLEKLRNHAALLQERQKASERELAEARCQAETAERQLLVASQRREALSKVRDRQRRLYDYEAARSEQKLLDELALRSPALTTAWRQARTLL